MEARQISSLSILGTVLNPVQAFQNNSTKDFQSSYFPSWLFLNIESMLFCNLWKTGLDWNVNG